MMKKKKKELRPDAPPIPVRTVFEISRTAERYGVERLVLFGSRARGAHGPKSDIDLAVYGCPDFAGFAEALEEEVWTLLTFNLIDMSARPSPELVAEIERDGIAIYEKV